MVQISNFSSVLEVSVALHLAYSLLRIIHDKPIIFIEKYLNRIKSEFSDFKRISEINEHDNFHMHTSMFLVQISMSTAFTDYEIIVKRFIKLSTLVAIISVLTLIISGFYPALEVSNITMILILLLLLIPMPSFIIATNILNKENLNEVHELLFGASKELCELREKYATSSYAKA